MVWDTTQNRRNRTKYNIPKTEKNLVSTPRIAFQAFSETDFFIIVLHYTVDKLNLQLGTCMHCMFMYIPQLGH